MHPMTMSCLRVLELSVVIVLWTMVAGAAEQNAEVIFAVVTKVSKDRRQVTAQTFVGGAAVETTLLPTDAVLENLVWKKLEVCHSLRAEGLKTVEGYRIVSVRIVDAAMLPMGLQGLAGDCLLKKALEFAPQID
jgi:hypothetical protein